MIRFDKAKAIKADHAMQIAVGQAMAAVVEMCEATDVPITRSTILGNLMIVAYKRMELVDEQLEKEGKA